MKQRFTSLLMAIVLLTGTVPTVFAQKGKPAPPPPKRPIVFAVLENGGTLEPIAYINKSKLEEPVNGSDDAAELLAFNRSYLRPGTSYKMIFGGVSGGTSTVKSSNPKSDCSKNIARVTTKANKTPLKGLVMALATNGAVTAKAGVRRKPTTAEKDEADQLARSEYSKQKLSPKVLRFHNLTAIDLENDGKAELVGSYWVEIDKLTRGLLFFIAGKGTNGKYAIGYSEYRSIDQGSVMNEEIKTVDEGVYHELLLDVYDFDGDGSSEIFTYVQSFEGAAFKAYRRNGNKWSEIYEWSNYHCAF